MMKPSDLNPRRKLRNPIDTSCVIIKPSLSKIKCHGQLSLKVLTKHKWGKIILYTACCLLRADFLFGFLLSPEDGGDIFLCDVG
jgi:hypothetical protein